METTLETKTVSLGRFKATFHFPYKKPRKIKICPFKSQMLHRFIPYLKSGLFSDTCNSQWISLAIADILTVNTGRSADVKGVLEMLVTEHPQITKIF